MIKKTILLSLLLLCNVAVYAQNKISGIIDYTLISDINESSQDEQLLTLPERMTRDSIQKQVFERSSGKISLNNIIRSKYVTVFENQEIITFWYDNPGKKIPFYYQGISGKKILSIEGTMSARYLVIDTMKLISWKISKISKKIKNIECFSAQAEYRGRVWTAWYAPSIPVSSGPWKLYGLPGMILEAEDRGGFMRFECISIIIPKSKDTNINGRELLLADKKTKKISYEEYIKELQESLSNYDKMNAKPTDGGLLARANISNPEIFAFEQATGRRKQQKLSDISKK